MTLLKNTAKCLITINGDLVGTTYDQRFQIKPGNNPAVDVPEELCKRPFVKALIKDGLLMVVQGPVVEDADELDEMTKDELTLEAEMLGIEVTSRMTKSNIIELIRAAQ